MTSSDATKDDARATTIVPIRRVDRLVGGDVPRPRNLCRPEHESGDLTRKGQRVVEFQRAGSFRKRHRAAVSAAPLSMVAGSEPPGNGPENVERVACGCVLNEPAARE